VQAHAWLGNSRSSISLKPGCPASSSRLRQYCLPWAALSRSRRRSGSRGGLFIAASGRSAVARVATDLGLDVVLLDQDRPQGRLGVGLAVGLLLLRRLPAHVEDLLARADVLLGLAVAVQAPLHQQRRLLPDQGHLVDPAVAGGAADALFDVDGV